jgi:hypothetical protein
MRLFEAVVLARVFAFPDSLPLLTVKLEISRGVKYTQMKLDWRAAKHEETVRLA